MEYEVKCAAARHHIVLVVVLLSVFPVAGLSLICAGLWVLSEYFKGEMALLLCVYFFLLVVPLGIHFIFLGHGGIMRMLASFRFNSAGLQVIYPFRQIQFEGWTEFQEICVCYAAYTTRGERKANTVICFVKKGESKASNGRWKTDSLLRYRSIIIIDYDPIILEHLRTTCPLEIKDLRNTLAYRL